MVKCKAFENEIFTVLFIHCSINELWCEVTGVKGRICVLALITLCGHYLQWFLRGHISETRWLWSTYLWRWGVLLWPLNHQIRAIITLLILWIGYLRKSNFFKNSQSSPLLKGWNVFLHYYLIELVDIVQLMNFFKWAFLVHELTADPIWAWDLHFIVKLSTILRLILCMKWHRWYVHLVSTMCKLTLVAIATKLSIRLDPILAHLCLVLCLVTLFGTVLMGFALVSLLLSASPPCLSPLLALVTTAWVRRWLYFRKFSLLY